MKFLLANKFFYLKGGSERAFFNEADLLRRKGHQVIFFSMADKRNFSCSQSQYFVDQVDYENPGGIKDKIKQSLKIFYSFEAKKKISKLMAAEKPDLAHLHNIHHQISPSIIHTLKKNGIPVVMTLHDYKMVCPTYTMYRNRNVCEMCSGGKYYRSLLNRCTKDSYAKSMINVVEMYLHHTILRIYNLVDVFISPSKFLLTKLKKMGFKKNIVHLPYLIDPERYEPKYGAENKTLCYFGRLSAEKGLFTLLEAMRGLNATLKIIGEGPLKSALSAEAQRKRLNNIKFLGYKSGDLLHKEIRNSMAVVVPSEWYENYPNAILESFALGKPVIGAGIGGIPELVRDNETGLTFEPGREDDLRSRIRILLEKPSLNVKMGKTARKFVEEHLNPEKHYRELTEIYNLALVSGSGK